MAHQKWKKKKNKCWRTLSDMEHVHEEEQGKVSVSSTSSRWPLSRICPKKRSDVRATASETNLLSSIERHQVSA